MINKIAPIFVFILLCIACKEKKETEKAKTEKAKTEKVEEMLAKSRNLNQGDGTFSITAPEGWEKKDTKEKGVHTTVIFSPLENDKDNFRDNVNVITEKIPSGYSLDAYEKISLENISKYLTNFVEIKRSSTTINGLPAKIIDYNHTMQGYTFDVMVYILLENNIAYIITCSTKKGDMEKYRSDFQAIANSFKLL